MSTVLKALQKVEELHRQQGLSAGDLEPFAESPGGRSRRRMSTIWLVAGLLTCGIAGAGVWYGVNRDIELVPTVGSEGSDGGGLKPVSGEPVAAASVLTGNSPPVVRSDEQLEKGSGGLGGIQISPLVQPPPARETAGKTAPYPAKEVEKTSTPRRPPAVRPRFVVSGIAYQDDRTVRFAIVNDVALGEGETIQGVVVEEIFEDRVRFARNGTAFEVALSKRKR
jgi:general secretion pathway protein B